MADDRPRPADPKAGAENLLVNCVGLRAGDNLLVVREPPGLGLYDEAAAGIVTAAAGRLGARASAAIVPLVSGPEDMPADLIAAMTEADHTIFFHRLGDQTRFQDTPGPGTKTMCYALSRDFLGADFCTLPHGLLAKLKQAIEADLGRARRWRITCPLGTDIGGDFDPDRAQGGADFTLKLFPITTFKPVSCRRASGQVVLSKWLIGTGSRDYDPYELRFSGLVRARVQAGRLAGFDGPAEDVRRIRAHYDFVAGEFGIEPDIVHSWHAGINPRTFFPGPAEGALRQWGTISFASPRYLHFHTCGAYAPGEITWSVFDPTVWIDDQIYWQQDRFRYLERPETRALIGAGDLAPDALRVRTDIGF